MKELSNTDIINIFYYDNIGYYILGFIISFLCILFGFVLYRKKRNETPELTPYEKWMSSYENPTFIHSAHSTHSPFNNMQSQQGNLSKPPPLPPPPPPPRKSFVDDVRKQTPVRKYSTRQSSMRRRSSNSANSEDEYNMYDIYSNNDDSNKNNMNNPLHK